MNPSLLSPDWNPGLLNDDRTLGEILESMPKDPASNMPWYVRMLENPKSPIALPGAIDLFGHDCLHAVLGRGTYQQDEAFVIGFTMGASGKLKAWQERLFRWCTLNLYKGVFRFTDQDQAVFDLAVSVGRWSGVKPLHTVDFRPLLNRPVREVREELGIRLETLYQAYECERRLWPDSAASRRLPHNGLSLSVISDSRPGSENTAPRGLRPLGGARAVEKRRPELRASEPEVLTRTSYS